MDLQDLIFEYVNPHLFFASQIIVLAVLLAVSYEIYETDHRELKPSDVDDRRYPADRAGSIHLYGHLFYAGGGGDRISCLRGGDIFKLRRNLPCSVYQQCAQDRIRRQGT